MNGLRVLKTGLIIGSIMVTIIFGAVSGYAQGETDMGAAPGQDMTNMTSTGQVAKMDMSDSNEDESNMTENHEDESNMTENHEDESNMTDSQQSKEEASSGHGESETEEASSGHGESKTEEAVPWTFIYGFLALNGSFVLAAGVMKTFKQRKVTEI